MDEVDTFDLIDPDAPDPTPAEVTDPADESYVDPADVAPWGGQGDPDPETANGAGDSQ